MNTGASDSLGTGPSIDPQLSTPLSKTSINKQTLIVASAFLLAVLSFAVLKLTAHATGQENANAGTSTDSSQKSEQTTPTAVLQDSASTSTSGNDQSSIDIKLNSSSTSSSNPEANS